MKTFKTYREFMEAAPDMADGEFEFGWRIRRRPDSWPPFRAGWECLNVDFFGPTGFSDAGEIREFMASGALDRFKKKYAPLISAARLAEKNRLGGDFGGDSAAEAREKLEEAGASVRDEDAPFAGF